MDGGTIGLIGGIAGSVIGVMGGIAGTCFSIRNANGPKERAFVIKAAVLCWVAVSVFLACLFVLPMPWQLLAWLVYVPLLSGFIRWGNAHQTRARVEDTTGRVVDL